MLGPAQFPAMAAMACAAAPRNSCSYSSFRIFLLLKVQGKALKLLVLVLCPGGLSVERPRWNRDDELIVPIVVVIAGLGFKVMWDAVC